MASGFCVHARLHSFAINFVHECTCDQIFHNILHMTCVQKIARPTKLDFEIVLQITKSWRYQQGELNP